MTILIIVMLLILTIIVINEIKNNNKHIIFENKDGTIFDILRESTTTFPDHRAYYVKRGDEWIGTTYTEYMELVKQFAHSLNHFFGYDTNVSIIGNNSPAWFVSHLGTMLNGGVSVGIYFSSNSETIDFILESTNSKVLIIDNNEQLIKCANLKTKPQLIIYYEQIEPELLTKFQELLKIPIISMQEFTNASINSTSPFKTPIPSKIATIIYTSGTTNHMKGALLTHNNIYSMVRLLLQHISSIPNIEINYGKERFVSFLPLNHIAAQLMDIYLPIAVGASVWFADRNALKTSLIHTLNDTHPTIFMAVPRVWEKIGDKIRQKINQTKQNNIIKSIMWKFISKDIKKKIGFSETKIFLSGGAPIEQHIVDYFKTIDIDIWNIYGMTETTGPISISTNPPHSGLILPEIMVSNTEDGEILVNGPTVFYGYVNDEKSSRQSFVDIDGKSWFKTGDIGKVINIPLNKTTNKQYLEITDRKKNIIITSGGEKVYPLDIEAKIKDEMPFISNAVLIGDNRKYLSILLTLKVQTTENGEPTILLDESIKTTGSKALTTADAIDDPIVKKYISDKINEINLSAISNVHHIKKYTILPADFSMGDGDFTPVFKLKRNDIMIKYKDEIDHMYN